MTLTYGELRKILKEKKSKWMPDEKFRDEDIVPENSLGGGGDFVVANPNIKLNLKEILSEPPSNPFLHIRRIDNGYIKSDPELESSKVLNPQNFEVINLKDLKESDDKIKEGKE